MCDTDNSFNVKFYLLALTGPDTGCIRRPTELQWINKDAANWILNWFRSIRERRRRYNAEHVLETAIETQLLWRRTIRMPTSVYLYNFAVDFIMRSDSRVLRFFNGFIYSWLDFNTGTLCAKETAMQRTETSGETSGFAIKIKLESHRV